MTMHYLQKQAIIHFLADPSHWVNAFDMAFFTDKTRKWKSRTEKGVTIKSSDDGTQHVMAHDKTHAWVSITRDEGSIVLNDESGQRLSYFADDDTTNIQSDAEVLLMLSESEMGLRDPAAHVAQAPVFGIFVRFDDKGGKTIFFTSHGQKIMLPAPEFIGDEPKVPGRFFHEIGLTEAVAGTIGMDAGSLMQATKLVIARDIGVEPDLPAFNALDPEKVFQLALNFTTDKYDPDWKGPWQWRPKIKPSVGDVSKLQKAWSDSTEFEGHHIAVPKRFYVERRDDGYAVRTSLDDREAIWAQGNIFMDAITSTTPHVETFSSRTTPDGLLHMLNHGQLAHDHRGREWSYILVHAHETAQLAEKTRISMRDHFGLTAYNFATLNFENGLCMMAMDAAVLERISAASRATVEMMATITRGQGDASLLQKFLAAGADLKYINPEAAREGRTWANELANTGNTALLAAYAATRQVHDMRGQKPAVT